MFSYLELPLREDQPVFTCKAPGHFGMYFVGAAQKVELEWAQDDMAMVVEPITVHDVQHSDLEHRKEQLKLELEEAKLERMELEARHQRVNAVWNDMNAFSEAFFNSNFLKKHQGSRAEAQRLRQEVGVEWKTDEIVIIVKEGSHKETQMEGPIEENN